MTTNQDDSLGDEGKEPRKEGVDFPNNDEVVNAQSSTDLPEEFPVIKTESEEEISDQYKKVIRQGPWLHPYPTIVTLSIVGLIISLVLGSFVVDRYYTKFFTPNFFSAPPDLESTIKRVQLSTVVVTCGQSQGTGWAVDLGPVVADANFELKIKEQTYPFSVITNHHVIQDCENNANAVKVSIGTSNFTASLFTFDRKNDLAIVATKVRIPELEISPRPEPGWWAMALGSPFGLEKSVSTGNVMNITPDGYVISTAPVNPGNSGGPLVNSLGQVLGTNTAFLRGYQSINIASDVDLLCRKLVDCGGDLFERDYVEQCDTWCQFKSWTSELLDFIFG